MSLYYILGAIALLTVVGIVIYLVTPRSFESPDTVANSYDEWTDDGILEFYWGEHIHLGHYGSPPRKKRLFRSKSRLCP